MTTPRRIRAAGILVLAGVSAALAQGGGDRLTPADEATVRYAIDAEIRVADESPRVFHAVVALSWADLRTAPAAATALVESFELTIGEGDDVTVLTAHRDEAETEVDAPDDFDKTDVATIGRLLAAPMRLVIDGDGRVQGVRTGAMRMMIGAGVTPPSDGVLGPLASEQVGRTLEPIFSADGAPAGAAGEWETSRAWSLGPARTVTLAGSWAGDGSVDGVISWRGDYAIELEKADDASPISPQVSIESFEGDVRAGWNEADSLLQSRTERLTYEAVWTIGDIEQRVAVRSTVTLHRLSDQAPESDDAVSE